MAAWSAKLCSSARSLAEKHPAVVAEDEDHPDDTVAGDERQAHTGEQPQTDRAGEVLQHAVDLWQLEARRVFVVRHCCQQRLQVNRAKSGAMP